METIGFIGTGHLGLPIVTNLLKTGYPVKVYNRTRAKAAPLEALGAELVDSPAATAVPGGIVLTLVSDDKAVESIADNDFIQALGHGGIHVSLSTISPDTSRALAAHHQQQGVTYVAAPVFARPEAAAAKAGNAVVSGPGAAKERVRPLLEAGFAKNVFDLGEDPGSANVLKLIGNFMIAGAIEMMAEAFTLAEKNGVDPKVAYEMLTTTLFAAPIFRGYGAMVLERNFADSPAFGAALGLKDMNLVLQTATRSHTPMPLAQLVQSRLMTVVARNEKDTDWVALATGAREDAGLKS